MQRSDEPARPDQSNDQSDDRPVAARERSVLDEPAAEDRDELWGDRPNAEGGRDDEWYRRERPPHHGD